VRGLQDLCRATLVLENIQTVPQLSEVELAELQPFGFQRAVKLPGASLCLAVDHNNSTIRAAMIGSKSQGRAKKLRRSFGRNNEALPPQ
jgi:hypothetical protein